MKSIKSSFIDNSANEVPVHHGIEV